ncbi:hypothetical protein LTR85_000668 [Meristemomyces frigidus]|nr:hypothetical protein LTR85_000668 [Meristemomyces frigidus]
MASTRARPGSNASSLMQDVPGSYPESNNSSGEQSNYRSLSQAVYARRAEYVRPKHVRIKVGSWNTAAYKGTEKDVGGWFVEGKGVTEALGGLSVNDKEQPHGQGVPDQSGMDEREDVASQEARYARKQPTIPKGDPGSLPGNGDVGLYVLGLQEVVDVNSFSEALRPYTDPSPANKWKDAMSAALPNGYTLVAEQQLIGMLLLVYASPELAKDVKSVSMTSVGTGIAGYMGNKGAVTARIVLGETTRMVFVNCHLSAGADKGALERRNWDAAQIVSRTRFDPIQDSMGLHQSTGEQIGDEDFAFWCGDLNYRLQGIPGDDVRRLLMLHTRNEYDLSQRSARKIENELRGATEAVKSRVNERLSISSVSSAGSASSTLASPAPSIGGARSSIDTRGSTDSTQSTAPTLIDEIAASDDPTSLQTTLSSLLPHDELHQQMKLRKAFHDGWQEGPITFLPTYKYDAGSVGVFDSSEKKRAPSWCDRILYRTRRDRLAYEAKLKEEEYARKKDEEMKANGTDQAGNDEEILYDYDPDTDAAEPNDDYDEYDDAEEGVVVTKEGFEDEIQLEYYTAHQRVLSSDHKPLDAVFLLRYDAVVPELKAKVHAEVAKELDKAENEGRPSVTVVVDKHGEGDKDKSDDDPANFEGVWLGDVRFAQGKHRTLTIANTGRVPASFNFIERPVAVNQAHGIAPKWVDLKVNGAPVSSSSKGTNAISLEPGETCTVELELRILDMHIVHELNEGLQELDDILVLRVEGGRDHFIPIRGHWQDSSLGRSIDKLTRIPEGGIRKLQRQRPDSSKSKRRSSGESEDAAPVRWSTPRELFRLTEAVEELSTRVVAEWEMVHPAEDEHGDSAAAPTDPAPPPWVERPAWPFDEQCWTERTTSHWLDALGDACNALDCDEPLEASLPGDLPKMQRLYVLASLLVLFLRSMPDGVITEDLWPKIDAYLAESEKARYKPSVDDERTAIQEILSEAPSHNISFILITSMLERSAQEIAGSRKVEEELPLSPTRRTAGALKRMAHLGRLPVAPMKEQSGTAMARVFADVVIRAPTVSGEKARGVQERRRVEVMEEFLKRDEPG